MQGQLRARAGLHNKTIVLASDQVFADRIAQRIGAPGGGVTVCKKLGVDYRLFGGDVRQPVADTGRTAGKRRSARNRHHSKPGLRTMAMKKLKLSVFATRSARIDKAAKRAARAGMLK